MKNPPSFTLIEILIVLALISILAGILILTIKPQEIFKRARDSKRISDLKNLEKALDYIYASTSTFSELTYASSNTVYISLPDNNPNCSSWLSELPSLPSGWSYHCSATPTNIDGTGWIPIPFSQFPILNISQLFIDPINKPPYYYSFVAGGSYAVYAQLEDPKNQASKNDGDNYPHLYSAGTDKRLIDQAQGLVGYWPFDEGSGNIAKDYSGNGNDGTLYNGPTWTTGKVGGALSFDGVDDYVQGDTTLPLLDGKDFTIAGWFRPAPLAKYQFLWWKWRPNVYINSSLNAFVFEIYDSTYKQVSVNTPITNKWYFLVQIHKGTQHKAYVFDESKLIGSSERNDIGPTTGSDGTRFFVSRIGWWASDNAWYQGLADEVRIYNRALSDSEIKALYESTR